MAMTAYSEQVGTKRHEGGVSGDMQYLYKYMGSKSNQPATFKNNPYKNLIADIVLEFILT